MNSICISTNSFALYRILEVNTNEKYKQFVHNIITLSYLNDSYWPLEFCSMYEKICLSKRIYKLGIGM